MRNATTGRLLAPKKHGIVSTCQQCGVDFQPTRGSVGKFCTMRCKHDNVTAEKLNGRTSYFNCCKCHASLGFGIVKSAQFTGKDKGIIAKGLRHAGVKRYEPDGGTWQVFGARSKSKETAWWGGDDNAKLWMDEYQSSFPDWSRLSGIKKLDIWITKYLKDEHAVKEHLAKAKSRNNASNRESQKKRKIIDPGFKVQCNLRHRLKDLMKTTKRGGAHHVSALIGCSTKQLAKHLESQFKKGMSWENYGFEGWHVDHILPCASFDHNDPKQLAQCWHWTNLRPLWAKENMNKSDTITEPQMQLLFGGIH